MGAAVAFPQPVVNWPLVKSAAGIAWAVQRFALEAAKASNISALEGPNRPNDGFWDEDIITYLGIKK